MIKTKFPEIMRRLLRAERPALATLVAVGIALLFLYLLIPDLDLGEFASDNPIIGAFALFVMYVLILVSFLPRMTKLAMRIVYNFFDVSQDVSAPFERMFGEKLYSTGSVADHERRIVKLESSMLSYVPPDDLEEIKAAVSQELQGSISDEIASTLERRYAGRAAKVEQLRRIESQFDLLAGQIERERKTVSTRTATNLTFGILIAGFGVYLLYGLLSELDYTHENWLVPLLQLASRLSVVIVVELFAYFFLNLYRAGVQEIKYFRNEITNTLSKKIAVQVAAYGNSPEDMADVCRSLLLTERNNILKAGESTAGILQTQNDRTADNKMLEIVQSSFTAGVNAFMSRGNASKAD